LESLKRTPTLHNTAHTQYPNLVRGSPGSPPEQPNLQDWQ
jgi:hypothetical protein